MTIFDINNCFNRYIQVISFMTHFVPTNLYIKSRNIKVELGVMRDYARSFDTSYLYVKIAIWPIKGKGKIVQIFICHIFIPSTDNQRGKRRSLANILI